MSEEITTVSWWTRIKDSVVGVLIGFVLIIVSIIISFSNEHQSISNARSLQEAQKAMVSISNSPVDPGNNLKVVYLTGFANTQEEITDPILGITKRAISLNRQALMYQWKEKIEHRKESQAGGSQKDIKTYTYSKVWSPDVIDSSHFNEESAHRNPQTMSIQSGVQYTTTVDLGSFILPDELIKQMTKGVLVPLDKVHTQTLENHLGKKVTTNQNTLYVGKDSQNPEIGDVKVTLTEVDPQNVSIIAQQNGNTLQPYHAPAGQAVILLSPGTVSGDEMIKIALQDNAIETWLLRFVSFGLLLVGFTLIMRPLVVLVDVLPFLGTLVGFGTGFAAVMLAVGVWILVTALAWFSSRPLVSIILITIVLGIGYGLHKKKAQNVSKAA